MQLKANIKGPFTIIQYQSLPPSWVDSSIIPTMKKVALVSGASGYLGGRLCHALLDQGYCVKAFVRKTSDISSLPPPSPDGSFQLAYGDVTDYPSLLEAFSGCNVIFHAAALVEPWIPEPSKFSSVSSTLHLIFFSESNWDLSYSMRVV